MSGNRKDDESIIDADYNNDKAVAESKEEDNVNDDDEVEVIEENNQDEEQEDDGENALENEEEKIQNKRCRWLSMERPVIIKGKKIISYPFLEDLNHMKDIILIQHLIEEEPYLAKFGEVGLAWENIAITLKALKKNNNDTTIYNSSLSSKTIRARFVMYIQLMQKIRINNLKPYPSLSGRSSDNEVLIIERWHMLYKLYDQYMLAVRINEEKYDEMNNKDNNNKDNNNLPSIQNGNKMSTPTNNNNNNNNNNKSRSTANYAKKILHNSIEKDNSRSTANYANKMLHHIDKNYKSSSKKRDLMISESSEEEYEDTTNNNNDEVDDTNNDNSNIQFTKIGTILAYKGSNKKHKTSHRDDDDDNDLNNTSTTTNMKQLEIRMKKMEEIIQLKDTNHLIEIQLLERRIILLEQQQESYKKDYEVQCELLLSIAKRLNDNNYNNNNQDNHSNNNSNGSNSNNNNNNNNYNNNLNQTLTLQLQQRRFDLLQKQQELQMKDHQIQREYMLSIAKKLNNTTTTSTNITATINNNDNSNNNDTTSRNDNNRNRRNSKSNSPSENENGNDKVS